MKRVITAGVGFISFWAMESNSPDSVARSLDMHGLTDVRTTSAQISHKIADIYNHFIYFTVSETT